MTLLLARERLSVPAARPYAARLSAEEITQWNGIVQNLGATAQSRLCDAPIWDEMVAKYPSLDLISRPAFPAQTKEMLGPQNAPPQGYRSPTCEHYDRTDLPDIDLYRIISKLRQAR